MDSYDIQIYKGATFSLSVTLKDENENPIDLTNYNVSGFLKYRYSDSTALTSLNAQKLSPLESGDISLSIHATGTAVLPVTIGVYDVELFNTVSGTVSKVLRGNASIFPEVTF